MRLGRVRAHHFGHKPDALCALTNPRLAERYNAARRIISLIRTADSLCISERCKGRFGIPCASEQRSTFAAKWHDIVLKKTSGETGPEVQFVRNGEVLAGLVLARSRAVTDAKDDHSVRAWVVADDVQRWNAKNPLPAFQVAGQPLYQCDRCSAASHSRVTVSGVIPLAGSVEAPKPLGFSRERVGERAAPSCVSTSLPRLHLRRVVDLYPNQGVARRHTFMMILKRARDGVLRLYLDHVDLKRSITWVPVEGPLHAAEMQLHGAFVQYLKDMCEAERAIYDSPVGWGEVDLMSSVRFPPRYARGDDGTWRQIAD
jgi:hypothetical protein